MNLNLLISNSLQSLANALSETISEQQKNVFQPDHIITQTDGMSNWLTLQIAQSQGIAANLQFLKPNDLIQFIFRLVSTRQGPAISRQSLDWLIFQVLGTKEFQENYPDKAEYFLADKLNEELKKLSLARKLSDLFDQYQVYRSEDIISWNKDALNTIENEFRWQAYIWKKINEIAGEQLPDMTDISTEILNALQDTQKINKIRERIPVIYLFGLSVITSYHIRILYELSEHIPLYIYLLNPAPEYYWITDKSEKDILRMRSGKDNSVEYLTRGNSLLTNWGKLLQSTYGMLYQHEDFLNIMQETGIRKPVRDTLLHKLQYDIYHNNWEDIEFTREDLTDGSLVLVGNYSRVREVQVLYNYLTELFDHKMPGLKARDILVMVNNIEDYSPYIRAIFDNAPYRLPYTIADEPVTGGNTPVSCLISILELNEQQVTAENILQLLEFKNIRDRYGIYDTGLIRKAVNNASIRFGIDNDHANDSYLVSWRYGLRRIMYGLCMSGAPIISTKDEDFIPLDEFEGTVAMEQLSLFVQFVEELFINLRERKRQRSLSEWIRFTTALLDNFIDTAGDENEKYIKVIDEQLRKYADVSELVDAEISFEIFSRHLRDNLSHEQQTKLFSSGGITFCSLIPMRSIPFQVIALLGMGFTEFPRKENKADFDLIHYQTRLGDRNIRDNDKQLFLETLLSAGQRLYISYTSRSIRDNSVIPPSILVDELLDYIQSGYNSYCKNTGSERAEVTKYLFTQHPLHNTSNRYNRDAQAPVNYLLKNIPAINFTVENTEEESREVSTLRLVDLISFMKKPINHYYKKVLGIYLNEEDILIPDTEVFTLQRLGESALEKEVVGKLMYGGEIQETITRQYLAGKLPLHNMGENIRQKQMELGEVVKEFISSKGENKIEKQEFELEINGLTITGSLPYCCGETLYQVITNSQIESGLLEAWITYIAGVAAGLVKQNALLHYHKNINETYQSREMSAEEAHTILAGLVTFYLDNKDQLLVFAPAFIAKDFQKCETDDSVLRVIATKVDNENNKSYDPYLNDAYFKGLLDKTGALNDVRYFLHKMEEAKRHLGIPN